ncbi:MAG: 50S ribosomal protein L11 methyltransferase [Christensenellales bacterium]
MHGNLADQAEGQYDLIFANIVADAVIALLPEAKAHLAENGTIIASGIILERRSGCVGRGGMAGLAVLDRKNKGVWVALALGER